MTKAMMCGHCGDIRGLTVEGVVCACGRYRARWVDPQAGTVRVAERIPPPPILADRQARIIGLHNGFLQAAWRGRSQADHRDAHVAATDAPGYLFDASKRGCWAVVIVPGESSDTGWESWDDWPLRADPAPEGATDV